MMKGTLVNSLRADVRRQRITWFSSPAQTQDSHFLSLCPRPQMATKAPWVLIVGEIANPTSSEDPLRVWQAHTYHWNESVINL